eukprot:scaffold138503_cov34-Attheya_sp.AAC.1
MAFLIHESCVCLAEEEAATLAHPEEIMTTLPVTKQEAATLPVLETQDDSTESSQQSPVNQDSLLSRQEYSQSTSSSTHTTMSALQAKKELSCNRRIHNVDNETTETCGKRTVVLHLGKQQYCSEHKEERNAKQRNNYQKKVKEEMTKNNKVFVPFSMSLLCAVSEDGFFLNIYPGSHKKSYFKDNDFDHPLHFSASERIHVPHTYMILFHIFFIHGGSAVPQNGNTQIGQQRLFAYYVNTAFLKTAAADKPDYKEMISKNRGSDIPDPSTVQIKPYILCCPRGSKKWLCQEVMKKKYCQEKTIQIMTRQQNGIELNQVQLWREIWTDWGMLSCVHRLQKKSVLIYLLWKVR